jgi:hypothetical protein
MSIPGAASPLFIGAAAAEAAAFQIDRSLRFNSADSAYLSRTPSSAGNRRTWTWSGWVKRNKVGHYSGLFGGADGSNTQGIYLTNDDEIYVPIGGQNHIWSPKIRDLSAWYHIVLAVDTTQSTNTNRIKTYINGVALTSSDVKSAGWPSQNVESSVSNTSLHTIGRNAGNTGSFGEYYLAEVHFVDGTALAASDFGEYDDNNVWQPKEYSGTYGTNGFHLLDFANESTIGADSSGNNNDFTANNLSPFRAGNGTYGATISNSTLNYDPSVIFNGNPASAYIDRPINNSTVTFTGIPEASTSVRIYLTSLESGTMTTNGSYAVSPGSQFPNAYIEPTNVTYPFTLTSITVTGGSSSHGYGIGAIEVDGVELENQSGPETDVLFDVPTNGTQSDTGAGGEVSGNYATLNSLDSSGTGTFSNGNLEALAPTSGNSFNIRATIAPTSGKWYWEYTMLKEFGIYGGIVLLTFDISQAGAINGSGGVAMGGGSLFNGGSNVSSSPTQAVTGDVMGFAWDVDNSSLEFFLNGTSQGTVSSIAAGHYAPAVTCTPYSGGGGNIAANFGARSFVYSAPSGYKALCTTNLPDPTIADGSTAMDVDTYTGTGTTHERSEFSFSPDFVWIKQRNTTRNNLVFDTVRGANKFAVTNSSGIPGTGTGMVTSFDSDGFTVGNSADVNQSGGTFVAWCWDGGTSTVSNTDGSITSNVRANASAGFSIVTYTGTGSTATIGHGLNAAPGLIIIKSRTNVDGWPVYHQSLSNTANNYLTLHTTNAVGSITNYWNGTNSSVIGTLGGYAHSTSGQDYVAYCFAPVAGYSAMGSYVGNGSNDGVFVHTGFSVRWLLTKASSHGSDWQLWDSARQSYNVNANTLTPNSNAAETGSAGYAVDFLSNGFKFRNYGSSSNQSGYTYIWAAFASNPFQANGGLAR